MFFTGYKCVKCGKEICGREMIYTCPDCGGNLMIEYDYSAIKKVFDRNSLLKNNDYSLWRYKTLYPVESRIDELEIGWSPLYKTDSLGKKYGLTNLYLKDDTRLPSGSFKDRAGAIVMEKAREDNIKKVCAASTGNAGTSTACLGAAMQIDTMIFVPETIPRAKLTQLRVYGTEIEIVKGTYDDAFDLCYSKCRENGWFNRSTGINPFTREGKKSCAFEICEQMNWEAPDMVFVPVGDGNIISGMWKGFVELYRIGFTDSLPRLISVQAEGSNAVNKAVLSRSAIQSVAGNTIADSISVSLPRDGEAARQAVISSGGFGIDVTDEEIIMAVKELGREIGVFVEPAGAAAFAGLKKAIRGNLAESNEKIVIMATGNGLKDIDSIMTNEDKIDII